MDVSNFALPAAPPDLERLVLCSHLHYALKEYSRLSSENEDQRAIDLWRSKVDELVAVLREYQATDPDGSSWL